MKTALYIFLIVVLTGCFSGQKTESESNISNPLEGTIIDLTYPFDSTTLFWPTADGFHLSGSAGLTDKGFYYSAYSFSSAEHGGTHLDAPVHFSEGKQSVDEIPLGNLIGKAIVIDISDSSVLNPDYQISIADVQEWENEHGTIKDQTILLFRTGFGKFWPDAKRYMGTDEKGTEAVAKLHFPGIHPETAEWLITNRRISAIGIDTPSLDYGQSSLFESHRKLFSANIPGFENVANMDKLPETDFQIIALPMKINGGSGGPLRIVAIVN